MIMLSCEIMNTVMSSFCLLTSPCIHQCSIEAANIFGLFLIPVDVFMRVFGTCGGQFLCVFVCVCVLVC